MTIPPGCVLVPDGRVTIYRCDPNLVDDVREADEDPDRSRQEIALALLAENEAVSRGDFRAIHDPSTIETWGLRDSFSGERPGEPIDQGRSISHIGPAPRSNGRMLDAICDERLSGDE